jgi:uncharacterized membrane protein
MRPAYLVGFTIAVFAVAFGATIYYQQFLSQMVEKLSLWLILSEILGFGGLISAEAYVFLWNILARTST